MTRVQFYKEYNEWVEIFIGLYWGSTTDLLLLNNPMFSKEWKILEKSMLSNQWKIQRKILPLSGYWSMRIVCKFTKY